MVDRVLMLVEQTESDNSAMLLVIYYSYLSLSEFRVNEKKKQTKTINKTIWNILSNWDSMENVP